MWVLKFLTGPKKGKEVILQPGLLIIGRDDDCQISLSTPSLSKKHAELKITSETVRIKDLGSSNGTFLGGKQIKEQEVKPGERIFLSDVVFEIRKQNTLHPLIQQAYFQQAPAQTNLGESVQAPAQSIQTKGALLSNLKTVVKNYVDEVILPGVYFLAEMINVRAVVALFVILFVVVVTTLSTFPLVGILKSSVEGESRDNAESIAVAVAQSNQSATKKGLYDAMNLNYALKRPGVKKAYIVSAVDGRILAPSDVAHSYPKESLIHKGRKESGVTVNKSSRSSLIAMAPISIYNPDTGDMSPKAYSVVVYDMSSLFVSMKQIISLLSQTSLITAIFGFILFFLLIKLIEFPVRSLSQQLDHALKEGSGSVVSINYQSKVVQDLCVKINSALDQISLSKMMSAGEDSVIEEGSRESFYQSEMNNLVELVGFPAIAVSLKEEMVSAMNSNFSEDLGFSEILNQSIVAIKNKDLKEHISFLTSQAKTSPEELAFGDFNLTGSGYQTACQVVMGSEGPAYAIISFVPGEKEEVA